MIRVLHVVTYMGRGGLETMLMNYYRKIDRTRIQFDFLVHRDFEADYDQEILKLGGKIYRVPKLNPFSIRYRKALNLFFKNHPEYQIVHVHQDCMSSIALKAAMKNNVPIRIAHSHTINQSKNFKFLLKKYYMQSIPKYATKLFACSREAGIWMFNTTNFTIVNNAIDSKLFKFNINDRKKIRETYGFKDELIIGHVGRFNREKNHAFLLDIFNQILLINPDSKLMLIGKGKEIDRIKEKVKRLDIENKVVFMGMRQDIDRLMQAMDIFIFPSLYEGLGVVAIEAQASGLPVIKSDNVPEECIVTENVISLSLDKSAKIWAEKSLEVLDGYKRLDTSQEIINAGYDISSNAKWLENYYLNEVSKIGK